jgi:hypothetical protein
MKRVLYIVNEEQILSHIVTQLYKALHYWLEGSIAGMMKDLISYEYDSDI